MSMSRPNILLITDDQHRWDFVGNQTVPSLATPALDRLRLEGTTLTHSFSNCPICMPTRFAWTTGLYGTQAAAFLAGNSHDWPLRFATMPQALQRAGYHTSLVGKLHSLGGLYARNVTSHESSTHALGFDDVFEVSGKALAYWFDCRWTDHLKKRGMLEQYRADIEQRMEMIGGHERYTPSFLDTPDHMDAFIGRQARQWLTDYDGAKPFYLHASFCGPHFPLDPPKEYFDRYRPEDMPVPVGANADQIRHWQEMAALYCAMITFVDDEIGKLLGVLQARGWSDNTLVLYGTDHGDMMGHHNQAHKGPPYDTSCRTPVTARLPGIIPAGRVLTDPAEAVDLPCTLLEAAGAGNPAELLPQTPGRSYWRYLTGEATTHRDWAFSEFGLWPGGWRMCRERDWKYVLSPEKGDMLFNMKLDPWEQQNLIDDPTQAERINRMRRQLLESMMRIVAPNSDQGKGSYVQR